MAVSLSPDPITVAPAAYRRDPVQVAASVLNHRSDGFARPYHRGPFPPQPAFPLYVEAIYVVTDSHGRIVYLPDTLADNQAEAIRFMRDANSAWTAGNEAAR